jgi:hypothetical protein
MPLDHPGFRFENPVLDAAGKFQPYWQRALSALLRNVASGDDALSALLLSSASAMGGEPAGADPRQALIEVPASMDAPAFREWLPPFVPAVPLLQDTIANQANYPAAAFVNWLYFATDTNLWYYSTGVAWAQFGNFDDAYNASTWDGSTKGVTQNSIRDKIEALPLVYAPLQGLAFNPADSTSYFVGDIYSIAPVGAGGIVGFYLPKATTLYAAGVKFINSVVGSNEASSVYIRVNNTTDYLISAAVDNSLGLNVVSTVFGTPVSLNAGDYIEVKWVTPAWVTNPTTVFVIASAFFK